MRPLFPSARKRRGSITLLAAFLLIVMLALVALSVDTGYMFTLETQLDCAVDASALAGAAALSDGVDYAEDQAFEYLERNGVEHQDQKDIAPDAEEIKQVKKRKHRNNVEIVVGHWDRKTRTFEETDNFPSAVRVTTRQEDLPLFFGRVVGRDRFNIESTAVATYRPREIMVVLDLSASMNDDSEFRNMATIGKENVVENLEEIWYELDQPVYGKLTFDPVYHASNNVQELATTLGLADVKYPYPSGSWNDYLIYVMYDSHLEKAGYRRQYGMLTLVHYWLARKPGAEQTPDLWKVSAQPMLAVKDAVGVFTSNVHTDYTDDRAGLIVYNGKDGMAHLETGLTDDIDRVSQLIRRRQAGHYNGYTNTGAALKMAVDSLTKDGRRGAFEMVILLTDGRANWSSEGYSVDLARKELLAAAEECGDARIPVITISLGADADIALMTKVAEQTRGNHFNVPGGQSVEQYSEELTQIFRRIAGLRPVQLVE